MYYHQETNKYIAEGQEFTLGDITYSSQWLSQIPAEKIAEMGLETVTFEGENKDGRFYWNGLEHDGAVIRIVNTPKDVDFVKGNLITQLKREAYEILQSTDYIEARNLRDPNYKIDWMLWRDQVRTYSSTTVADINNALDIPALEVIMSSFSWPQDPSYIAPVALVSIPTDSSSPGA
jgi:hypothetical protein